MKLRERRDERTQNAGRALFPAGDPVVYIRVAFLEQRGIDADRVCIERIDPPVREPPEQEVHLTLAAVPGAEFQSFALDLQLGCHRPFPSSKGGIAWPPDHRLTRVRTGATQHPQSSVRVSNQFAGHRSTAGETGGKA